jgi:hypothetical protein
MYYSYAYRSYVWLRHRVSCQETRGAPRGGGCIRQRGRAPSVYSSSDWNCAPSASARMYACIRNRSTPAVPPGLDGHPVTRVMYSGHTCGETVDHLSFMGPSRWGFLTPRTISAPPSTQLGALHRRRRRRRAPSSRSLTLHRIGRVAPRVEGVGTITRCAARAARADPRYPPQSSAPIQIGCIIL